MFIGPISFVASLASFVLQATIFPIGESETLSYFLRYGVFLFFHLATIWLLIILVSEYRLPLKRILLYTLNPWVLQWITGEGIPIILPVFFFSPGPQTESIRAGVWFSH